jgi:hypothetical protein
MTSSLTLLSRAYCSLCDAMLREATSVARARGLTLDVIDVDAHPALVQAWDTLVPVLFLGAPDPANELCHYHFDAERVNAGLEQANTPARRIRIS